MDGGEKKKERKKMWYVSGEKKKKKRRGGEYTMGIEGEREEENGKSRYFRSCEINK